MKKITVITFFVVSSLFASAQDGDKKNDSLVYKFTDVVNLKASSVKDQYRSGTCWAFSGLSFLEAELIRMGKGEHDLAEMWMVKKDYHARAIDYVRWQGAKNFGGGAESNNVFDRIKESGIVPEVAFPGLDYDEKKHVHGEMDHLLDAYVKAVVEDKNQKLSSAWIRGFDGILDAYLGDDIEKFSYQDKEYTPISFRDAMNIVPDDYIEIGSFTHHPFYTDFVIEVPDNWSLGRVYNVPMNEMLAIV
jgi:bleomycin hydrolase